MDVPAELREAIQQEIETVDRAELAKAAAELSQHYRAGHFSPLKVKDKAHRAAYLAVRFPATCAATSRVFAEIQRLAPQEPINSILDLGAGPGTALFAAAEIFPTLDHATLIEADRALVALGKRITARSLHAAVRDANWLQQDIKQGLSCELHDLVVASYVLDELPPASAREVATEAWRRTRKFLAIVEPGTMRGFGFVSIVRALLIAAGAYVVAPCPHAKECPMVLTGDWCHFATRVRRTSVHRQIKQGTLGYEDEKFSYVVFSRNPLSRAASRVVRHPQKHSGHVGLALCTPQGLRDETVTKRQKETYKLARRAAWGDPWDF